MDLLNEIKNEENYTNLIVLKCVLCDYGIKNILINIVIKHMFEINDKLNRVIYKNNINNKLTEQIFCNLGFLKNVDVKKDNCLKDFYSENNYINDRMLG